MATLLGRDVRLERRAHDDRFRQVAVPLISVLAALLACAVFMQFNGDSALVAYRELIRNAFLTWYGFTDTLASGTPLIFTGLAAAFAFKMGLYNIGGEGQLYAGAITAAWAGLTLGTSLPGPITLVVVLLAGAFGGAMWVLVPAVARARLGTSEIVTTLMLNYVALNLLNYLIFDSQSMWRDKEVPTFPQGRMLPDPARFHPMGTTRVTWALFVAIALAVVVLVVQRRTSFGYEMDVIGDSPAAARYAGIPTERLTLVVLLCSGAMAGLAGAEEVSARAGRLDPQGLAVDLGYTGIIVAVLSRYNPVAVVPVALLLGGLQTASINLQSEGIPVATAYILQAAILLFALGGEVFRTHRLVVTTPTGRGHDRLAVNAEVEPVR